MSAYGEKNYMKVMIEHAKVNETKNLGTYFKITIMNKNFFQISAELAQIARKKATLDNNVKIYGVLGPICESHQPGTTKKFIETHGNFRFISRYLIPLP